MIPKVSRHQLLDIPISRKDVEVCTECAPRSCSAWISVPGYFDFRKQKFLGALKTEGAKECWDEYPPAGTNLWSKDAPIALDHYP